MANGYFPLVPYNVGKGIDFSPVNDALDQLAQTKHRNALMERDDKRLALDDQRWRTTDARSQQQFEMQRRKAELDEQGMPLERDYRQAQIDLARAQATSAGQKNQLESALAGLISGSVSDAPAPHPTPGSSNVRGGPNPGDGAVIPQSYGAPPAQGQRNALMEAYPGPGTSQPPVENALFDVRPQPRLGVVLASDELPYGPQAGMPAPSAAAPNRSSPPGDDLIETPLGRMPRDRARRLGMGLALAGKGDAGRMLADSATPGANLQKPTQNAIEERILNSATQLGRLADIERAFDPTFMEIPKRMEMLGQSWSAKFGGKLSKQQTQELSRYAKFRSASVNNLNTILKEMSGAAVTPQEYERIQNDAPVAGTGIFDGDDPVSFKAKLERTKVSLRNAIARQNYMRARGLNFSKDDLDLFLSLDDIPAAYEKRGDEIEATIRQRNPGIEPQALEEQSAIQLKREWGI
jgi:hypothetical protein